MRGRRSCPGERCPKMEDKVYAGRMGQRHRQSDSRWRPPHGDYDDDDDDVFKSIQTPLRFLFVTLVATT